VATEGTPFGRYRLIEVLGRGGMGEVWRAYDTVIERPVALKVLPASYADDPVARERFEREARKAAGLNQRNVIAVHDVGEVDGRLFVTMPIVAGRDLQSVLQNGPLPASRAVAIIEQIAAALDAAHARGLVHRDVKPSNILLEPDDFAYLIDFGIARAAGETGLTNSGATVGTWAYMAPERFRTGAIGPACDTYALTCVLYQCLTGRLPFPGEVLEQIAVAHMMEPPPRPSEHDPRIPAAMDAVIATGMAKDPAGRYPSATELAAAARAALADPTPVAPEPTPAAPEPEPTPAPEPITTAVTQQATRLPAVSAGIEPGRPPRRRRRALILTALGVAVVAVIATVAAVMTHHPAPSGTQNRPTSSAAPPPPFRPVLPFTGLNGAGGIAVDGAGTVYVTDYKNDRVLRLAAGADAATELGFTNLKFPTSVAVDRAGAVYVTDSGNNRVLRLAPGAADATQLAFTNLNGPSGVAVDSAGTVYVSDWGYHRVLRLAPGAPAATQVALPDLEDVPGVAVDRAGAVYVTDWHNNRVLRLAAGAAGPTELAFTGLNHPWGVAVAADGAVYVTDNVNSRALRLAPGANAATELAFTGLAGPEGVAVDTAGTVYVVDSGNNRVVALRQQ